MYLISVYFDESSDKRICSFMKQIARSTAQTAMIDENIPPHLTIAAFHAASEEQARGVFEKIQGKVSSGKIQWVSVGAFFPNVIYLTPVLNEYLHQLSELIYEEMLLSEVSVSSQYRPFSWLPHATLGKKLNKEQMQTAFEIMQSQFGVFESQVIRLGLAKTNPHTDLIMSPLE